jgi:hypothetical protein
LIFFHAFERFPKRKVFGMIECIRSIVDRARWHAEGDHNSAAYLIAELAEALERVVLAEAPRHQSGPTKC